MQNRNPCKGSKESSETGRRVPPRGSEAKKRIIVRGETEIGGGSRNLPHASLKNCKGSAPVQVSKTHGASSLAEWGRGERAAQGL